MKNMKVIKPILVLMTAFMSVTCLAELAEKAPLKVNFNSMIEKTSNEKNHIQGDIADHYKAEELDLAAEDTQKVIDFVDVEIRSEKREEKKVELNRPVDRRYNSVGVARLEEPNKNTELRN